MPVRSNDLQIQIRANAIAEAHWIAESSVIALARIEKILAKKIHENASPNSRGAVQEDCPATI